MGRLVDAITFPIRALLIHENSSCGLSSLRDERMRIVAKDCVGRVLDVGCGRNNVFVQHFLEQPGSIGIDCFAYDGVDRVVDDMTATGLPDGTFDTITLIAVGGHIPRSKREAEFREFGRLLKDGGVLLMTEGEPVTQHILHRWQRLYYALLGKKDMDSERGMLPDEEYCMPRRELLSYLNTSPLKLRRRVRFMWGLNNLYIAEKRGPPA